MATQLDLRDEQLQTSIHGWRTHRAELVRRLERSNWADIQAARDLADLNLRIEMLTKLRDMRWWYRREPSLDQIAAREQAWHWETDD
jgi:hypothetical protein